jgi:uncharacterized protein YerC
MFVDHHEYHVHIEEGTNISVTAVMRGVWPCLTYGSDEETQGYGL